MKNVIFSPSGEGTYAPQLDKFCYSSDELTGPIYGSTNVLTFVFDSNSYSTYRGYFISVSAGIKIFLVS